MSWLDRFDELAKKHNEPWRKDLLSRALAQEAKSPGSVSPRALWIIGTIEKPLFDNFAALLDLSVFEMIPARNAYKIDVGNGRTIGHLTFSLSDVGLIGASDSMRGLPRGSHFRITYGSDTYLLEFHKDYEIGGIIFTKLGHEIASFYEAKPNDIGRKILADWLAAMSDEICTKKKLDPKTAPGEPA